MKKILTIMMLFISAIVVYGQDRDVTKFLGIPVDGTKSEMIQKLKQKGFVYNSALDALEGEFNGDDVTILITTNKNKVSRIMILYYATNDESAAITCFNSLFKQFYKSSKYTLEFGECIEQSENIEYEIQIHHKRYWGVFIQDNDDMKLVFINLIRNDYKDYCVGIVYSNLYNESYGEDL